MTVLRPITMEDLPALHGLAQHTGYGLTTLPRDEKFLRRRIKESLRAFEAMQDEDPPAGQSYLFVLEDLDTKQVVGTSAIFSKVGGFEPFYAYRLETTEHHSTVLGIRKQVKMLHLVLEHDGPSEIGSLFLEPTYRKDGNGRLLSLARFLFLAEHPSYFDPLIIAEMRGVVHDGGLAPFWEGLGKHFFDVDFPTADYLAMVQKKVIAELMPRHPIYVNLLPRDAQDVIGKVHQDTVPALKLLQSEGFREFDMVDIFEAGPVVRCPLNEIRTVRESVVRKVYAIVDRLENADEFHLCRCSIDFRACKSAAEVTDDGVTIPHATAEALKVSVGENVRLATVK